MILVAFLIYYQRPIEGLQLLWFPVIVLVQLVLTIGLALFLSALTVHFRDLKDLLGNLMQFWFFATPIIYPMHLTPAGHALVAESEPDDAHHDARISRCCFSPARTGIGRGWWRSPWRRCSCS